MTTWIIVPIKMPSQCKTRLQAVLDDASRAQLVDAMLRHVVMTVAGAAPVSHLALVGPSRHGLSKTIELVPDPGPDLNSALDAGRRAALAAGADRLLVLAADLPHVNEDDVDALLRADPGCIVIAPDDAGTGTNALLLPAAVMPTFEFQYGEDSCRRHVDEAGRLGVRIVLERRLGLAFDVDEPDDLAMIGRSGR